MDKSTLAHVVRELRQHILNCYRHGDRLVSKRELSSMYGVGATTVHRALQALYQEGLINSRARVGWYCATNKPKARAGKQPLTLGILTRRQVKEIQTYELYSGILAGARARNWEVVLGPHPKDRRTPNRARVDAAQLPWSKVDVALLIEAEDVLITGDSMLLQGRKLLAVDYDATRFGIDSVVQSDGEMGEFAARHLLQLEHRRFAVVEEVCDPGFGWNPNWTLRRQAFEATVGAYGGTLLPDWRVLSPRSGILHDSRSLMLDTAEKWTSLPPNQRPTAIFGPPGPLNRLARELAKRGWKIPGGLSLISMAWDGHFWGRKEPVIFGMRCTSINSDLTGLVQRTLDWAWEIHQRVSEKTRVEPRQIKAPFSLLPGKTTIPPDNKQSFIIAEYADFKRNRSMRPV